jgi:hypothetical protein
MTVERKPVAYGDARAWIEAPRKVGQIQDVDGKVD